MDPLSNVGVALGTDATKWSLMKIKKHIGYFYKYKENLKSLEAAETKLGDKRTDASRSAQDSNRELKDVSSTIARWRLEADELYHNAQENISRNNISCLNVCSRYSTSKHAFEMALEINQKVQEASDFGTSFDRPVPNSGDKYDRTGFMEFKSRISVVDEVCKALKDENVRMCSICGMGGTGKTTLAKMLIQRVEADHLFDKVAMVIVSEIPDFEKIQLQIIELLGLKIYESSMPAKANKLHAWLTDNRKTLLILDDVWWQLKNEDFENIGIPVVSREGCKLLITSRNVAECKKMGSQQNFLMNVLPDGEGWALFKHVAGECVERDLKLLDTAKKIAHKCGGLPMVIVTLAAALKDEIEATWNDTLVKLENLTRLDISEVDQVYSRIQLSYDLLNDKEAQACFHLCSLFPEDYNVLVEHLVWFRMGLELFEKVKSMKEARDRVESKIHKLKKSFLLLDGEVDGTVKMHDILRDFAISISSKDVHPYIVGFEKVMEKWPGTDQYENCTAISFVCDKINEHPLNLRCPHLHLLQVLLDDDGDHLQLLLDEDYQVRLPNGFFEGSKELKVLVLKVPSLLPSLTMLKELRTLIIGETRGLDYTERVDNIGDLLGRHGDLRKLEILVISRCKPCDDFPVEIGLLCNLRCLRLIELEFNYMPTGVLSKLVKLEELELLNDFNRWGCKDLGWPERFNAGLDEIESLPLTTLNIGIPIGSIFAEKLLNSLTTFRARTKLYGDLAYHSRDALSEVANVDASDIVDWMNVWVRKCQRFKWSRAHNLKNIMSLHSSEDNGFPLWKEIDLESCKAMEYLVDTIAERMPSSFFSQLETLKLSKLYNMEEICPFSKIEAPCFSNLSSISISKCPKLKHLFPLSVARDLRQVQCITIRECEEIGEIFYKDGVDDHQVASSSFQELCTPTVEATSSTPTIILNSQNNVDNDKPDELISCCPLPTSFIPCLRRRSEKHPKVMVSSQQIMEENIAKVDEKQVDHDSIIVVFPQLKALTLDSLNMLRILYDGNHAIDLPALEVLLISGCDKMEGLSYGSLSTPKLKEIEINETEYPAEGEDLNAIVKKELQSMNNTKHPAKPEGSFNSLWGQYSFTEDLSYGSLNTPKLKEIEINDTEYPVEGENSNAIVKKELQSMTAEGEDSFKEGLSYGSLNTPKLKEIEINETEYPAEGEDPNAIVKKELQSMNNLKHTAKVKGYFDSFWAV